MAQIPFAENRADRISAALFEDSIETPSTFVSHGTETDTLQCEVAVDGSSICRTFTKAEDATTMGIHWDCEETRDTETVGNGNVGTPDTRSEYTRANYCVCGEPFTFYGSDPLCVPCSISGANSDRPHVCSGPSKCGHPDCTLCGDGIVCECDGTTGYCALHGFYTPENPELERYLWDYTPERFSVKVPDVSDVRRDSPSGAHTLSRMINNDCPLRDKLVRTVEDGTFTVDQAFAIYRAVFYSDQIASESIGDVWRAEFPSMLETY